MTIAADLITVPKIVVAPVTDAERAQNPAALQALFTHFARTPTRAARPDLADAAEVLLRAHAHATSPSQLPRWQALPPGELDSIALGALRTLAVGCLAANAALDSTSDVATRARLPLDLVERATAERQRMMKYLGYHFDDHPVLGRELAGIRAGGGHRDLESDMRRISVLVAGQGEALKNDRLFQANDAQTAVSVADQIAVELGSGQGTPTAWIDQLWAVVKACYVDEIRPTAEWLYRRQPGELMFYPSIFVGFGRRSPAKTEDAPSLDVPVPTPGPNITA